MIVVKLTEAQSGVIPCDSPVDEPIEICDNDDLLFRAAFLDGERVALKFLPMAADTLACYCIEIGNCLDLRAEDSPPGERGLLRRASESWHAIARKIEKRC